MRNRDRFFGVIHDLGLYFGVGTSVWWPDGDDWVGVLGADADGAWLASPLTKPINVYTTYMRLRENGSMCFHSEGTQEAYSAAIRGHAGMVGNYTLTLPQTLPPGSRFLVVSATGAMSYAEGTGVATLDDLTDVTAPAPSSGDVLTWNGAVWVNATGAAPGAHAATHAPGQTDALATGTPATIGTANAEGNGTSFARNNHVHDHGSLAGGDRHEAVTTSVNGFMTAADKSKLNGIDAGAKSDHGSLSGNGDDDHTQYFLCSGARAASYVKIGSLPASAGAVRLSTAEAIYCRNYASGSADVRLLICQGAPNAISVGDSANAYWVSIAATTGVGFILGGTTRMDFTAGAMSLAFNEVSEPVTGTTVGVSEFFRSANVLWGRTAYGCETILPVRID